MVVNGINGYRIAEIRRLRGMRQCDLAKATGIGQSTISQYETGQRSPSFETCERIAKILGTSPHDLIGQSVDTEHPGYAEIELHCATLDEVPARMAEYQKLRRENIQTRFGPLKIIVGG